MQIWWTLYFTVDNSFFEANELRSFSALADTELIAHRRGSRPIAWSFRWCLTKEQTYSEDDKDEKINKRVFQIFLPEKIESGHDHPRIRGQDEYGDSQSHQPNPFF